MSTDTTHRWHIAVEGPFDSLTVLDGWRLLTTLRVEADDSTLSICSLTDDHRGRIIIGIDTSGGLVLDQSFRDGRLYFLSGFRVEHVTSAEPRGDFKNELSTLLSRVLPAPADHESIVDMLAQLVSDGRISSPDEARVISALQPLPAELSPTNQLEIAAAILKAQYRNFLKNELKHDPEPETRDRIRILATAAGAFDYDQEVFSQVLREALQPTLVAIERGFLEALVVRERACRSALAATHMLNDRDDDLGGASSLPPRTPSSTELPRIIRAIRRQIRPGPAPGSPPTAKSTRRSRRASRIIGTLQIIAGLLILGSSLNIAGRWLQPMSIVPLSTPEVVALTSALLLAAAAAAIGQVTSTPFSAQQ